MRVSSASGRKPTAVAGKMTALHWLAPATGNQRSQTAKKKARKVADRKLGSALIVLVTAVKASSKPRLRFSRVNAAASMPKGRLMPITSRMAASASSSVFGSLSAMTRATGSLVTKDLPNSRCATLAA
jgi:hypothetical protein